MRALDWSKIWMQIKLNGGRNDVRVMFHLRLLRREMAVLLVCISFFPEILDHFVE